MAGFVGVLLIVVRPGAGGQAFGVVLTLAGVVACAIYTVVCRRLLADDTALAVVLIQQAVALAFAVVLFALGTVVAGTATVTGVSVAAWLSAVTSGLLYYAIAFWMFINLIPVFGIAAGHLLLAERLTGRQWLGAGIVFVAVSVAAVITPARSGSSVSRSTGAATAGRMPSRGHLSAGAEPQLLRMLRTWLSTVCSEMSSRAPIGPMPRCTVSAAPNSWAARRVWRVPVTLAGPANAALPAAWQPSASSRMY